MRGFAGAAKRADPVKTTESATLAETIQYMWPYLMAFRGHVVMAVLALIAAKTATLVLPYGLKLIVDALDGQLQAQIMLPLLLVIGYGVLRFASVFFGEIRDALFGRVTEHAMRQVGLNVFKHLHQLDLSFHLNRQTGGISRDIERGTNGISFLMRFMMFNIIPTLLEILLVAVIFWSLFSIWYALITAVAVIAYIIFTVKVTEWRNQYIREANQADSSTNSKAIDSLLNYETVKYFNNEAYEAANYDKALAGWEQAKLKNRLSLLLLNSGQALIIASAITAMLLLAADGVVNSQLTLGDFAMVNAYMLQLFLPLNFLGFVYREIKRALTDLENMLGLFKLKPEISDTADAQPLQLVSGLIEFKDVHFAYQAQRPILQGLSFTAAPGEKTAIVGSSGAGKSTISRLIYRFYDVQQGTICIDNQSIAGLTLDSLRQTIAIVPQDTVLFNTSIRENIAYGDPQATDIEIDRAIDLAHLRPFINSLPLGDQTLVGERGLKVSGGEKQRIAIARVLLKRSPILIFDEATSALDSQTEQSILQAIHEVSAGHTSIVIAHRLSTIIDAHQIIVLDQGVVIEKGRHEDLLMQCGVYAAMWALQQQESAVTLD
jgi:ABC-type transport system involved in Fe-S cluster assembly fused permease/ATPase subunit